MYDIVLGRENTFKDKVVTFGIRISFSEYVNNVILKTLKGLVFVIGNSKYFLKNYILDILYNAFIWPSIEYTPLIWSLYHYKYPYN